MMETRNQFGFPVPLRPSRCSLYLLGIGCLTVAALLAAYLERPKKEVTTPKPEMTIHAPQDYSNTVVWNAYRNGEVIQYESLSLEEFKRKFHCQPTGVSNGGAEEGCSVRSEYLSVRPRRP